MADTRGSYRLLSSSETTTGPGGVLSFASYSGGTLRLSDTTYTRSVRTHGETVTEGVYVLGSSVNTILNKRHGNFSLTSNQSPQNLTGTYDVIPDFTLTFNYRPFALPDQSTATRTETWIKVSDSPRF